MTEPSETPENTPPKAPQKPRSSVITPIRAALFLTTLWVLIYFIPIFFFENLSDPNNLTINSTSVTNFITPLIFIWLSFVLWNTMRKVKSEVSLLRDAIEIMQHDVTEELAAQSEERDSWSFFQHEQMKRLKGSQNDLEEFLMKEEAGAAAQQKAAEAKSSIFSDVNQPSLPLTGLGVPGEGLEPLNLAEKIQAINFPNDARDQSGLRLMNRAEHDAEMGALMKSARSLLSAFAEDGIYMDDIMPNPPQAKIWRKFVKGKRGSEVAVLGGIQDRTAFALTKGRLKSDVAFREVALNFMREFDRFLSDYEKQANDTHLLKLGQTRSARAFMLIGRCTGAFV